MPKKTSTKENITPTRSSESYEDNPYLHDHSINRGDIQVFKGDPGPNGEWNRRHFVNAAGLRLLVFPGDVVSKSKPEASFAHHWHNTDRRDSGESLEERREEGWFPVSRDEFWVRRWGSDDANYVRSGSLLLLALPEELYDERENEFQALIDARSNVQKVTEQFEESVRREGLAPVTVVER